MLSLPYGAPESFDAVWQAIRASLLPGGYFVGQLFGPNHYKGMNHIVRHKLRLLLCPITCSKRRCAHIPQFF